MSIRRIIGICVCVLGLYLLYLSIDGMHQIAVAKGEVESVSSMMPRGAGSNPVMSMVGGDVKGKIARATTLVTIVCIVGIGLTAFGGIMAMRGRKKRR